MLPFPDSERLWDGPASVLCELEPATGSPCQVLLSPLFVSQAEGLPVYVTASSLTISYAT